VDLMTDTLSFLAAQTGLPLERTELTDDLITG
jgi:hypothetical protein